MDDLEAMYAEDAFFDDDDLDGGFAETLDVTTFADDDLDFGGGLDHLDDSVI